MDNIPQNKKERVAIYIDGSNFYNYLKDKEIKLPKGIKFDFNAFVKFLLNERECVSKRYYVGIFRNIDGSRKSEELVSGQQKFLSGIENDGFTVKRGRIMRHADKDYKEKGTDVKIAVDLIIGAVDDIYDTAILVSSDTDLIPAVKYIKYRKRKLEYIGFSHNPSLGMQKYADLSILLTPKDVENLKEKTLL
jgi:uncharacterized LabA/DUF88 family protein